MNRIRILLVDDHALFREGLSRLLEGESDLEMVAHCASVGEALDCLRQKPVDIVLLDYDLGKERGLDLISQGRQLGFKGRFLMVTAEISDAESVEALDRGATGIFHKHLSPRVLTEAIHKVMEGETWLDENAIQSLIRVSKHPGAAGQTEPFSEREDLVLRGVFEGLTNKEIAKQLNISESSVKAVLQQLFHKTGVKTRSQLVRFALEEHATRWKYNRG